jgi:hypothetical protein
MQFPILEADGNIEESLADMLVFSTKIGIRRKEKQSST